MTGIANDLDLKSALENVRATTPLVHSITNYVTVNDCANALLACGGSPIMSDEPKDVADIQAICGGLVLNIGTLNEQTIAGMYAAGARARELGHPIVLDPVGAGASQLRTATAEGLLRQLGAQVIRCNMSEMKALAGASAATRCVDVNPDDVVTPGNLEASAAFACEVAAKLGSIVAITGAIDLVADAERAFAIRNGSALMGKITGAGCMLSCVVAAYVVANPNAMLEAAVAAVAGHGLAGQIAEGRMQPADGNDTFRTYLLDALYNMDAATLEVGAQVEQVR
jgi:hydroxyethylthiazole kinase